MNTRLDGECRWVGGWVGTYACTSHPPSPLSSKQDGIMNERKSFSCWRYLHRRRYGDVSIIQFLCWGWLFVSFPDIVARASFFPLRLFIHLYTFDILHMMEDRSRPSFFYARASIKRPLPNQKSIQRRLQMHRYANHLPSQPLPNIARVSSGVRRPTRRRLRRRSTCSP